MAITFNPISEKRIREFFKTQKEQNRRFRSGEFIEAAIIDRILTIENKQTETKKK
jgi:hypothetical protein